MGSANPLDQLPEGAFSGETPRAGVVEQIGAEGGCQLKVVGPRPLAASDLLSPLRIHRP
jgi:hypothetical protein